MINIIMVQGNNDNNNNNDSNNGYFDKNTGDNKNRK